MLIKLFKSGYTLQIVVFIVAALLLWVQSFIYPIASTHELTPAPLYNYLHTFLGSFPLLQVIIAFVLIITQAIFINRVLIDNGIIQKNSFLPAFVYLVIMSQGLELQTLYPALLSNFFLCIVLYYLFSIFNKTEAYVEIINASVLVGIASLFYLPAIFFILIIWLGFIVFSIFIWREWIISLLGLMIPYLFLFVFYFWVDRVEEMLGHYLSFFETITTFSFEFSISQTIILSVLFLFTLLAIHRIIISLNTKTINIRKKSIILIWFFLISLISLIYTPDMRINYLALSFLPAACLISNYFAEIKKKFIIEMLFLLLVLLIFSHSFFDYA